MNDELVTARAAVVSKLLVIAPYSAFGFAKPYGVQTGEYPRQSRPADQNPAGLLSRALPAAHTYKVQVSKAVITSAAFVASGAECSDTFSTGIGRKFCNEMGSFLDQGVKK